MKRLPYPTTYLSVFLFFIILSGCKAPHDANGNKTNTNSSWQNQVDKKLPLLGHRNWILIVDKAFPEQTASGIEYVYANQPLATVLKQVLAKLDSSGHVKPIIYQDKELTFVKESDAKGLTMLKKTLQQTLGNRPVQTMLHDSVFKKLDTEAKLFKVLVIKTDELIPYTSVFLQLDCGYWSSVKETNLRAEMKEKLAN